MIPIIHRVNKVNDLKQVNNNFGLEIDVRHNNDELVLDHGIKNDSDKFLDFIKLYKHKLLGMAESLATPSEARSKCSIQVYGVKKNWSKS